MTRLTDDLVRGVSGSLDSVDDMLRRTTGMGRMEMACDALGLSPGDISLEGFKAFAVPITSGLGVIKRFSESVAEIARKLGMDASVTESSDVTGFAEAVNAGAETVFMADDTTFAAYNVKAGTYANNSFCTAAGYTSALKGAAGGLEGRKVLVLGAGRVGSIAAGMMVRGGAAVCVADIETERAERLASAIGAKASDDIRKAISSHDLILNASPARIPGSIIREGAIISSPGIPHTFDAEGLSKATVIHDPLDIGTSVMAMQSASFSRLK
ncbi:MAG: 3-methylornithyl-N6-L-lysine dehydrogenase PylD [Candidatus Methanoplasma sp.]|jgi:pyrrolysine biosynthesis protein PylD|nr:3-methylornithyl-N6-L-lysine dehydrogenase PylD [Candidatus Methanoplasma sp.]